MADNTQKVVRNYPGNYTVLARGGASTPSNTYEVSRIAAWWLVKAFDAHEVHDAFQTLGEAKAAIQFWAQRDEGEQR